MKYWNLEKEQLKLLILPVGYLLRVFLMKLDIGSIRVESKMDQKLQLVYKRSVNFHTE